MDVAAGPASRIDTSLGDVSAVKGIVGGDTVARGGSETELVLSFASMSSVDEATDPVNGELSTVELKSGSCEVKAALTLISIVVC